jgi:hypothetical protein
MCRKNIISAEMCGIFLENDAKSCGILEKMDERASKIAVPKPEAMVF